nr:unnamed protein product [Digitaria exilis]
MPIPLLLPGSRRRLQFSFLVVSTPSSSASQCAPLLLVGALSAYSSLSLAVHWCVPSPPWSASRPALPSQIPGREAYSSLTVAGRGRRQMEDAAVVGEARGGGGGRSKGRWRWGKQAVERAEAATQGIGRGGGGRW